MIKRIKTNLSLFFWGVVFSFIITLLVLVAIFFFGVILFPLLFFLDSKSYSSIVKPVADIVNRYYE